MSHSAHLWAIGYDDPGRAAQVRQEIAALAGPEQYLLLLDVAVVVRHADGSFTFDRDRGSNLGGIAGGGLLGFLAGLALAAPLAGAAIGALLAGAGSIAVSGIGLDETFILDVANVLKPSSSALFVLDDEGDMDVILHAIRGLGGTILKTNVDVERAKLIEATLRATPATVVIRDTAAT